MTSTAACALRAVVGKKHVLLDLRNEKAGSDGRASEHLTLLRHVSQRRSSHLTRIAVTGERARAPLTDTMRSSVSTTFGRTRDVARDHLEAPVRIDEGRIAAGLIQCLQHVPGGQVRELRWLWIV